MIVGTRFDGHEPPSAVRIERDACGADRTLRVRGIRKPVDMPQEGEAESRREQFGFDQTAADLTAPFRRIDCAGGLELGCRTVRRGAEGQEHDWKQDANEVSHVLSSESMPMRTPNA